MSTLLRTCFCFCFGCGLHGACRLARGLLRAADAPRDPMARTKHTKPHVCSKRTGGCGNLSGPASKLSGAGVVCLGSPVFRPVFSYSGHVVQRVPLDTPHQFVRVREFLITFSTRTRGGGACFRVFPHRPLQHLVKLYTTCCKALDNNFFCCQVFCKSILQFEFFFCCRVLCKSPLQP